MPEFVSLDGRNGIRFDPYVLSITLTFRSGQVSTFKAFPSASGAGRSFTADMLI
jgi:hypothetical protein